MGKVYRPPPRNVLITQGARLTIGNIAEGQVYQRVGGELLPIDDPLVELQDHIDEADGAHAASAIAFTPTGPITAEDVDAAIVQVEALAAAANQELSDNLATVETDLANLEASLGTIATQDADAVNIDGGSIDGTPIGATTPSTGKFSTLTQGEAATLIHASSSLTDGAGGLMATLLNSPVVGNPTKWVAIDDGGVTRYLPLW